MFCCLGTVGHLAGKGTFEAVACISRSVLMVSRLECMRPVHCKVLLTALSHVLLGVASEAGECCLNCLSCWHWRYGCI